MQTWKGDRGTHLAPAQAFDLTVFQQMLIGMGVILTAIASLF